MPKTIEKVLGLDLGTNSMGFSLNNVETIDGKSIFDEIVCNSIVFDNIDTGFSAKDRTDFRGGRRKNKRSSKMMERVRKYFVHLGYAEKMYISSPTKYIEQMDFKKQTPYGIRQKGVINKKHLSRDEFIFTLYSIINHRGYSNQFATGEDKDEKVLGVAISKNKKIFDDENFILPSSVLFMKKKKLEDDGFINIAIRNKSGNYNNSLNREMWKLELELIIDSQKDNKELFPDEAALRGFKKSLLEKSSEDEKDNIGVFEQRPLKSTEHLINYCSFYNRYNATKQLRCMPKINIINIELTIRQILENTKDTIVDENGEIYKLSLSEIQEIVDYWIEAPPNQAITFSSILKSQKEKKIKIIKKEKQDDLILDIKLHKNLVEIFNKYNFDYKIENNRLYNEIIKSIHVWANDYQKKKEIKKADNLKILSEEMISEIVSLDKGNKSKYSKYSLQFGQELLMKMKVGKTHHEALEDLGLMDRYLDMSPYDYLPPLNPTRKDIKWLIKNKNFKREHLFNGQEVNPAVKRVVSILRRLVNDIIAKYGKPDRIVIETANELNNDKVKKEYQEINSENKESKKDAKKKLEKLGRKTSAENIERLRLFKEQNCICLYTGEKLTEEDALNEELTEREHFIPRSFFFDDSWKNKILVLKKHNQNKSNSHPVSFLQRQGLWSVFKENIEKSSLKSNKKKWLADESSIDKVYKNPDLITRYLNDTRSATRIIKNYLEHYLYPKKNRYGKSESSDRIITVTGKAIHQLKYIWGVSAVEPKDFDSKKNRLTNYHHTLDALVISMVKTNTRNILHSYFKQKEESRHKNKVLYEKLKSNYPVHRDGYSIASYAEELVRKYKNNEKYVCPMYKYKDNTQGFNLGNINLKILNIDGREILVEFEKQVINSDIFYKKNDQKNPTSELLSEKATEKEFDSIKNRLCKQRQVGIIEALDEYAKKYSICVEIKKLNDEIKKEKNKLPPGQKVDTKEIIELKEKVSILEIEKNEPFYFLTKKGKKQIVKNLELPKKTTKGEFEKTKADVIYITDKNYKGDRLKRLDIEIFKKLRKEKVPFCVKTNYQIHSVDLFDTVKGQVVGLNYFSGIENDIPAKINSQKKSFIDDFEKKTTIKKYDILEIYDTRDNSKKYYLSNGGGNISDVRKKGVASGCQNNITVSNINTKVFKKLNRKKNEYIYPATDQETLNNKFSAKVVRIDFYGNIIK